MSVHRGEYLTRYTPQEQTPPPPRPGTPPGTRYTPRSRHPLGPGTPPRSRYLPGVDTPPRPGTPPGLGRPPGTRYTPRDQVHPPGADPPKDQVHPPQERACWEIRSTRGRYASYWNAILFPRGFVKYYNRLAPSPLRYPELA